MSKEAMKLALELAEDARRYGDSNLARKAIKTITVMKEALVKQEQGEPVAWPVLNTEEREALERFNETCEDGQEYDVSKSMMKHLAELGVVYSAGFGRYGFTEFGRAALNTTPQQRKPLTDEFARWYWKACDSAQPYDWMKAALAAQQILETSRPEAAHDIKDEA